MPTKGRQPPSLTPLLAELARLYGVEPRYRDMRGHWRESPAASVVAVLRALGADLGAESGGAGDGGRLPTNSRLTAAIQERRLELWYRMIEPVIVAWDGVLPDVTIRLPEGETPRASGATSMERSRADSGSDGLGRSAPRHRGSGHGTVKLTLVLEGGGEEHWETGWDSLELVAAETLGHTRFEARNIRNLVADRVTRRLAGASAHPLRAASAGEASGSRTSAGQRGGQLPCGYHRLRIETRGLVHEASVIAAPRRCWAPQPERGRDPATGAGPCWNVLHGRKAVWGLFAPLYGLQSEGNWGAGDLADLEALCDWVEAEGGTVVATLPLLASFLDRPFEPAPYRPVSRLYWNEFYLAVDQIPEWESCAAARDIWIAAGLQERLARLRADPLVDYRETMALKRRALMEASHCFFESGDAGRKEAFCAYLRANPDLEEYAAFRAGVEALGRDWRYWPGESPVSRAAELPPAAAAEAVQYHLYCQWQMEEQLTWLSGRTADAEASRPVMAQAGRYSALQAHRHSCPTAGQTLAGLFLDLPLGVHPGGFDTWRWPELFVAGMSAGAPPDSFFALGQDWESPPLHPERMREQGHEYFARCLRHHMRHAQYLRIDHVMALHRLFWVPARTEPTDGVYVSYRADELYAVLCLESDRNRTVVAGEDLGTVPGRVRATMRRHGVLGMWVFQNSLRPRAKRPVRNVPPHTVAGLNTHDMFPFAGFLRGDDITARVVTGQLDPSKETRERENRLHLIQRSAAFLACEAALPAGDGPRLDFDHPHAAVLLPVVLAYLAGSRASLLLVNLDDLVLETRPQNLPGTGAEQPNWRRKVAVNLETLRRIESDGCPFVTALLTSSCRATAELQDELAKSTNGSKQ